MDDFFSGYKAGDVFYRHENKTLWVIDAVGRENGEPYFVLLQYSVNPARLRVKLADLAFYDKVDLKKLVEEFFDYQVKAKTFKHEVELLSEQKKELEDRLGEAHAANRVMAERLKTRRKPVPEYEYMDVEVCSLKELQAMGTCGWRLHGPSPFAKGSMLFMRRKED